MIDTGIRTEYETTYDKLSRYEDVLEELKKASMEYRDLKNEVHGIPADIEVRKEKLEDRVNVLKAEIRFLAVSILNDIVEARICIDDKNPITEASLSAVEIIKELMKHPLHEPVIFSNQEAEFIGIYDIDHHKGVIYLQGIDDVTDMIAESDCLADEEQLPIEEVKDDEEI